MINFFRSGKFSNSKERIKSYEFLELFIESQHSDWSYPPRTDLIVDEFLKEIRSFNNEELAFLICHTGYIPENYPADSSQETLYTKLVEAVVMEWAFRIGFHRSSLPTQKSSKEDVTIMDDECVIVCDAKSFRLGRSQGAPNVKDVLKHADISKWLSEYKNIRRLGGLVTFPSQHDWKRGSDFYQYTTDKSLPTLCLNYEHMSYMLISGYRKEAIIGTLENYGHIFPNKLGKIENNRKTYYSSIENFLFGRNIEDWNSFRSAADLIISEHAYHCSESLLGHVSLIRREIEDKYRDETDIEKLRQISIDAEFTNRTEDLNKQLDRIYQFRYVSDGYHEE